jgi:hypothetical protein
VFQFRLLFLQIVFSKKKRDRNWLCDFEIKKIIEKPFHSEKVAISIILWALHLFHFPWYPSLFVQVFWLVQKLNCCFSFWELWINGLKWQLSCSLLIVMPEFNFRGNFFLWRWRMNNKMKQLSEFSRRKFWLIIYSIKSPNNWL